MRSALYYYRFGTITVASEISLPGLWPDIQRPASTTIQRAFAAMLPVPGRAPASSAALRIRRRTSQNWLILHYSYQTQLAEFAIRKDGRCIKVYASDGVFDADLAMLLEGPILGGSARLLGQLCLHATLLTNNGRAMALMGPSGAGKSSLAWALLRQGCRLLSDDVALAHGGRQSRGASRAHAAAALA